MKRTISVLLAVVMISALSLLMTACDKAETETLQSTAEQAAITTADVDEAFPLPEALAELQVVQMPFLEGTGWNFTGGMVNNAEMDQETFDATLEQFGGSLGIVFTTDSSVQMTCGDQVFDGAYILLNENYAIYAEFEDDAYYGVSTQIDGDVVMVLSNANDSSVALYFSLITE